MKTALRVVACALGLVLSSAAAHADVAPPPGQKQVGFSFTVKGIPAGDRALFAYPCGQSSGAPMAEYQRIDEGKPLSVGRRGGGCAIYSIEKAKLDEFAKTYKPTMSASDPALDGLAGQAVKCTGAPSPMFVLASTDKRTSVEETLKVTALDATTCTIVSEAAAAPAGTGTGTGTAPANTSKSGCSATPAAKTSAGMLPFVAIAVLAVVRRRRLFHS